jgi:hypothetical protein
MLGMKTYTQDYIDACQARVDADLRAYRKQVGKAPSKAYVFHLLRGRKGFANRTLPWSGGA